MPVAGSRSLAGGTRSPHVELTPKRAAVWTTRRDLPIARHPCRRIGRGEPATIAGRASRIAADVQRHDDDVVAIPPSSHLQRTVGKRHRFLDVAGEHLLLGHVRVGARQRGEHEFLAGYGSNPPASGEGSLRYRVAMGLELLAGLLYWKTTGQAAMLEDYRRRLTEWLQ